MQWAISKGFQFFVPGAAIVPQAVQSALAAFVVDPGGIKSATHGVDPVIDIVLRNDSRLDAETLKGIDARQATVAEFAMLDVMREIVVP